MNPGSSGVVLSSLVEGATVSSNRTDTCLPHSTFAPPALRHLESLLAANSVSFDLIVSCSSC